MDTRRFEAFRTTPAKGLSRRGALGRLAGGGAALLAAVGWGRGRVAAQGATTEQFEVDFVVSDPVIITRAGGGPPQRGDWFYIDGPVYAAGDFGGSQIGVYQCFGAWTHAADDTAAPDQRLTSVQFRFDDGAITGLINEAGTEANDHVGAVQGGTGRYAGATGTFQQIVQAVPMPGATPAAEAAMAATPAPGQLLVRAVFDLTLPPQG